MEHKWKNGGELHGGFFLNHTLFIYTCCILLQDAQYDYAHECIHMCAYVSVR